jgi:hypothetical protein
MEVRLHRRRRLKLLEVTVAVLNRLVRKDLLPTEQPSINRHRFQRGRVCAGSADVIYCYTGYLDGSETKLFSLGELLAIDLLKRDLVERVRWLKHAEFFVGLSSGLSWLARASGTPVVMISGFTHPTNEFDTPYRVINYHTCNGCWNDVRHRFDHKDFLWCPRHKDTPRHFECTRLIISEQVKSTIRQYSGIWHGYFAALRSLLTGDMAARRVCWRATAKKIL